MPLLLAPLRTVWLLLAEGETPEHWRCPLASRLPRQEGAGLR